MPDHHNVYVVELDSAVLERKKFVDANPQYQEGKSCFYVGMTGLSPQVRFENHKRGYKANRYVREFGKWLRPRMFEKYNPMSESQARRLEVELAEKLRAKGHAVWQK